MQPLLSVKNLSVKYDNSLIFKELSFNINKGDKVAITGESGSGKTTLINTLCGFNTDFEGEVTIAGLTLNKDNISIEENNTVKLIFSNKSIDNNDHKFELLKYLREKFNEEKIQIITEIIEKEVVKKDKPMDEYMKLKKEYPSVEKIRTQLDLDF
jgi:ABC-type dipeptide/oligopeptide/nickel transport system ATPase subunit